MSSLLLGSFLSLALAVASEPTAPQEGPPGPACLKCGSRGTIPCNEHPRAECELERNALYCSVLADCAECGGLGIVDCPKCDNRAAEEELEKARERFAARGKKLKWVDEKWNEGRSGDPRALRKVESEHFVLVWEMEGMKVDRRRLTAHETMHLYVDRLELMFDDYLAAFHASPREFKQKVAILVWYLPNEQKEATVRFCGTGAERGVKLMGATPRYSVCANRQFHKDDDSLYCNLAHSVGHLLLSHQDPAAWIGNKKYGWADEGVAHWFEDRYFGLCRNYCYQEQNTQVDFKGGKYKPAVRKLVATGKFPPVAEVWSKTSQELTPLEHALSFSYVDYLLTLDGEKFGAMMKLCRRDVSSRDALKACYGMNPLELEAAWKEWVLETYPAR